MEKTALKTLKKPLRQVFTGLVVSDKVHQTITVMVERKFTHPLYKKTIVKSKKYLVHDINNQAKINDKVKIIHQKPISKRKTFALHSIYAKKN